MLIEGWDNVWGGGQKVALEISRVLSSKYSTGVDLFVMNLGNFNKKERINENFNIIRVGKKLKWCFKDRLRWLFLVKNEIIMFDKRKKYDMIYCHANLPGLIGKILGKRLKIPVIYHVHGSGVEAIKQMYGQGFKSKFLYWIEVFLQRKIKYDLEITVDRKFLNYKNVNKPIYIPNGVDLNEFERVKAKKEKDFFKVLFVGRLHPQKGLIYLVKAANEIKDFLRKKNVKFVIVGDGEERSKLISLIKGLNLVDLFVFRGMIFGTDLIKEYKSSHLLVLPSLYEGMPLTVLEAWASKLPVLVTKVGDLPFIVKEGENGWLVRPGDSRLLSEKLKKVLSLDSRELKLIGEMGYVRVVEDYRWEVVAKSILNKVKKIYSTHFKKS